uniref:BHLH domain-containing protein n=1 Tax=Arundo donax TaxID=35708 RepID=A0A0A9CH21_ARUDO
MSALVDALCAPSDAASLIYDTFNTASFLFDNAAAFCDAGIVGGPAPSQQQAAKALGVAAGTAAAVAAAVPGEIEATSSAPTRVRKRRRRARSCKSREETESQRLTHIAVERNRRRQMNEYLAVLRSLMPESYVQRGDQASIVGGAIEFVKELEQQLQSLEAQKRTLLVHQHKAKPDATPMDTGSANAAATTTAAACVESTTTSNCSSSVTEDALADAPPFAGFFTYPQYVWRHSPRDSTAATLPAENGGRPGVADIEVSLVETHASVRVMTPRRPGQLITMVAGLQALQLTVLHLSVTTLDALVLYSISVKVEEGCGLTSVDDITDAVHHVICIIDAEAATQQMLAAGQ